MTIAENLQRIRAEVDEAAVAAGRDPASVRIMPVSKYHSADQIREAHAAGYTLFGENRVQEMVGKHAELADEGIGFAIIGNVQSNKAKPVAELAAELQSLDSLSLAENLNRRCAALGRRLPVLVQVNTSGEAQKSGIAPEEAVGFARKVQPLEALDVRGLMTMAVFSDDDAEVAACFRRLLDVQARIRDALGGGYDELSMGMSGDFKLAVAHGSTCVRIGTAIFGPRLTA
ncbi:YggS family pyridoxal phosphate-dependent enzyme [Tessaracoccus sp. ZS01]|uniref:YggS family pyridoxal phosphate-dependent enzyme n=1 Tax=Tessaracoccus sp. ZS01 TaxID=1906324 RepID=UPI00097020DD|nr:YggS family pyridoxal phosphate-dependent enzyme [Tessaracoccus sp. ZS01]MCG6566375.1 YggS family pyridoxal phosphate-dependent enzyme [Tessaracoccus sp. ZS01]OMG59192.1 YggS family pyridoxal phosphate enzyme [Tessaracoccus sp. ZS01]